MPKNVIVAQSGGPSPVINSSLRGVVEACRMFPDTFGTVYGGWHGIEGVLREELLNLSVQTDEEIALLRYTPAAGAVGTCRYKLKKDQQEDFARVMEVFKAHDIGYFFYNGGNDSMDTAHKVAVLAKEQGLDLVAVGVPKTIDNDVGDAEFKLIDHTPGYGSVARYWMGIVQNADEENRGSCPADPVLVLQAMGRKIGYIPAAARLADPKREMPLQIYMAESKVSAEELCDNVNQQLLRDGRCVVVVSEGFDVGELGDVRDSFGHTNFGATQITAAQKVVNLLNANKLPVPGKARGQVSGTDQRSTAVYASVVDLDEAYKVGQQAVLIAVSGENGWMSTILREPGPIYNVRYDKAPLELVANSERTFPEAWISPSKTDVTDDFVRYAKPLIGEDWASVPVVNGRQRFARLAPVFADKKLPEYLPQALRK
ncbi:MAG TPA: diphosphate--fructose-6-phosphate 1-phosphotransferase [Candidatus Hydrogenedentes bacterium]|nr:diphosphate--fructose-6-phosphate 1-phosphotransferase [Candidatus Hydrogenedentota bacterium]HOC72405.1 diphosphate--fructose-6-phosphate 1-phosphotransferase [Candidatus Hydrogenedentota bacterium]HOH50722.1 diphosphate--fructose-6-phosphate 1-phosphotransferase [Candidatus Hydrogenedentota bacterium]HRZ83691.1 diphosphate--fructose-6-phosphate 1-phosphotransferase [Candidatus Hydrogenedentota bacterium]